MLSTVRPGRQRAGGDSDHLRHNLVTVEAVVVSFCSPQPAQRGDTASQIVRLAYSQTTDGYVVSSIHECVGCALDFRLDTPLRPYTPAPTAQHPLLPLPCDLPVIPPPLGGNGV